MHQVHPDLSKFYKIIGATVRQHRLSQGLSQDDLSKRSNLCRRSINKIESGESARLDTLMIALDALDLHLSDAIEHISKLHYRLFCECEQEITSTKLELTQINQPKRTFLCPHCQAHLSLSRLEGAIRCPIT